jgi:signal peptidase I
MEDPQIYPSSAVFPWNADHFGPITVPAKGMTMLINEKNLAQYERVITYHEGHKDVQIDNNQLWIDGQQVESYTFQQDYYFMMGDNRYNSQDTRFWSFVPQDHIVGKAVFVLFSLDPNKKFLSKIRWRRIFRLVG